MTPLNSTAPHDIRNVPRSIQIPPPPMDGTCGLTIPLATDTYWPFTYLGLRTGGRFGKTFFYESYKHINISIACWRGFRKTFVYGAYVQTHISFACWDHYRKILFDEAYKHLHMSRVMINGTGRTIVSNVIQKTTTTTSRHRHT